MRSLPAFFATCAVCAQAAAPSNPKSIIEYLYAHPSRVYMRAGEGLSPRFFSPALIELYRKDRQAHRDEAPNLDFDFLSNSQDPEVSRVVVTVKSRQTDRQTIKADFLEMNAPQTLEYDFIRLNGTWLIDEVRCPMKGGEWSLSGILKGRP